MDKRLSLDYMGAISEFDRVLRKFNLKKKLFKLLFRGRGLEFEQFRDFDNDEDANSIDWPASLRANKFLVRQYIEETDINFYFVVDSSSRMLFGSGKKLKAEYAAEIILSLSNLVMSNQDRASLVMFNKGVIDYIPSKNFRNQLFSMQESVSNVSFYGGEADFEKVIEFLLQLIKGPNNMVIFISDFLGSSNSLKEQFRLLRARCEVIALAVRDPLDLELPLLNGSLVLSSSRNSQTMVVDTSVARAAYKNFTEKQRQSIKAIFYESDIDFLELSTKDEFVMPIMKFIQERQGGSQND